jgi:prolyl 4-hydroxylase
LKPLRKGALVQPAQQFPAEGIDGATAHLMAMRAAEGAGVPQDWTAALDLLRRSAELGFRSSQAELAALAGDWVFSREIDAGKEAPFAIWKNLRAAIDPAGWLATPSKRILSANPRIAAVERFAAPETCDWLISRARDRLVPAQVYDRESGGPRHEGVRTNSECHLLRDESDLLLAFLRARIARVTDLPVPWMEATSILHYAPGQEFLPHLDFLDTASPGGAKDVTERGQRVLTFLLCLNDDYEGGETEFPALGTRWKGRKGNALFFWNVDPNGTPDRLTRHAGLPPTRGEKWLLSQWIRARGTRG